MGAEDQALITWYQGFDGLHRDGIVGKETGGWLLIDGDPYYGGHNYCYRYVPSRF
ncbi:hypothetical protein GCM10010300_47790 [Streptomyces olivaceoviridis]|uniref:hypothetical protein n=1 Tax=Streptomyces olivaceoviridis TaxID=1921 RepID=UPI00198D963C|nr:hypothetical protein [Streptomyces olivaceoviridis]GGY98118.1 hypothetical protein GCM10010300_47790 [Streptomyces olivaceoviridis]